MNSIEQFPTTVGLWVRTHRKAAGLTQKHLADLAGIGKTAVFDLEKGKATVRLETVLAALAVLNGKLQILSPLAPSSKESEHHV